MMAKCPQCGGPLRIPPRPYWMNPDQWDSTKAGDFYCQQCPPRDGRKAQSGYCYWSENEVAAGREDR